MVAKEKALREYHEATAFLGVHPTLEALMQTDSSIHAKFDSSAAKLDKFDEQQTNDREEKETWTSVKDFMPFGKPKD